MRPTQCLLDEYRSELRLQKLMPAGAPQIYSFHNIESVIRSEDQPNLIDIELKREPKECLRIIAADEELATQLTAALSTQRRPMPGQSLSTSGVPSWAGGDESDMEVEDELDDIMGGEYDVPPNLEQYQRTMPGEILATPTDSGSLAD